MAGRKKAPIDLTELEKLCVLQCTQEELAAYFNVSTTTIENRMKEKEFREIVERGKLKGLISVRRRQMQLLEAGNATMAVWLGKQLLGQRDYAAIEHSGPHAGPIEIARSPREHLLSRIARIAERRGAAGSA